MTWKVPTPRKTMSYESYNSKRFSKAENLFRATKGSEFLNSLKVLNTRSEMISSDMMKLNIVRGVMYRVILFGIFLSFEAPV